MFQSYNKKIALLLHQFLRLPVLNLDYDGLLAIMLNILSLASLPTNVLGSPEELLHTKKHNPYT